MAWVLDLDGVVWLADEPIDGAAAAVAELRRRGEAIAFVTNNSAVPRSAVEDKLRGFGIEPLDGVVTSAMAGATLVEPGETALLCGGPGIAEELEARGVTVVRDGDADAVVVGFHRDFDYERMRIAATAVRNGARLIATNDDATYPTPDGPIPGGGSILASIATASGVTPIVAGKPYPAMVDLVRARVGSAGIGVGDRPDTDGRFARALGFEWGLVLSGVTRRVDLPVDPRPDIVADDLADLVARRTPG
jgi:4-nitrophenyl phosphatase